MSGPELPEDLLPTWAPWATSEHKAVSARPERDTKPHTTSGPENKHEVGRLGLQSGAEEGLGTQETRGAHGN